MGTPMPRCRRHPGSKTKDCPDCRARQSWYNRLRHREIVAGTWQHMRDPRLALLHVERLHTGRSGFGKSYGQIAREAGITERGLELIVAGRTTRIHPLTEAAILGVKPAARHEETRWPHLVLAVGTRRRVQGMAFQCFTHADIAAAIGDGTDKTHIAQWVLRRHVHRDTASKVAEVTDRLMDRTGPSPQAARRAAQRPDWWPLEAWGDRIDDPDAVPYADADSYVDPGAVWLVAAHDPYPRYRAAVAAGWKPASTWRDEIRVRDTLIRLASVAKPAGPGLSAEQIADLAGLSERGVQRVRARHIDEVHAWLYAALLCTPTTCTTLPAPAPPVAGDVTSGNTALQMHDVHTVATPPRRTQPGHQPHSGPGQGRRGLPRTGESDELAA